MTDGDLPGCTTQGRILGGALGAWAPRGHQRGAKKKEKRKRKERERGGKIGKKRKKKGIRKKKGKKERDREHERKKKERKLNQYDERGAMQFQVQAGAPGKKTSGAPN